MLGGGGGHRKVNVGEEVSQPAIFTLATPPKVEDSPSAWKLGEYHGIGYSSQDDDTASIGANDGFRLVDISILASMINMLLCPICSKSKVWLKEDEKAKMVLQHSLHYFAQTMNAYLRKTSILQKKYPKDIEVHKRIVLAGRNIGTIDRCFTAMNMSPPMNQSAYLEMEHGANVGTNSLVVLWQLYLSRQEKVLTVKSCQKNAGHAC